MWRLLAESVRGPAHEATGQPCQDAALALVHNGTLILAASDGAGSAALSHIGSAHACSHLAGLIRADLDEGLTAAAIDRDTALSWVVRLRSSLAGIAKLYSSPANELACTLLFAVVSEEVAAFGQVGDGCIVILDGETYRPVFWPQTGEYANTTFFVTEPDAETRLDFASHPSPVDEVAVMTDGMQGMALCYADRSAHQPFFRPMFAQMRQYWAREGLGPALRAFLSSAPVRLRSDDDKTLILAARGWGREAAHETE
jgi:hypothetical protein